MRAVKKHFIAMEFCYSIATRWVNIISSGWHNFWFRIIIFRFYRYNSTTCTSNNLPSHRRYFRILFLFWTNSRRRDPTVYQYCHSSTFHASLLVVGIPFKQVSLCDSQLKMIQNPFSQSSIVSSCRLGLNSLNDTRDLWQRNKMAGIPFVRTEKIINTWTYCILHRLI